MCNYIVLLEKKKMNKKQKTKKIKKQKTQKNFSSFLPADLSIFFRVCTLKKNKKSKKIKQKLQKRKITKKNKKRKNQTKKSKKEYFKISRHLSRLSFTPLLGQLVHG